MDMSPVSGGAGSDLLAAAILGFAWVGPVGLLVLRKQLARAQGMRLFVKSCLLVLTVVTAPIALLQVYVIVMGGWDATATLWSFVRRLW
jgi:hypothetical protein